MNSVEPSAERLCAIILAGGRSSRMGQDKALLPVNGTPMLRQVYDVAVQCTPEVWVVTPWRDRYATILPESCRWVDETPLARHGGGGEPFHDAFHGPLVGFCQGLEHLLTVNPTLPTWILLLACDLPRLEVEVLQQWMQGLSTVEPSVLAVLPKQTHGWEPLCGFYRTSCLPDLQQFIAEGGRSFQRWLASRPVQPLTVSDAEMLTNCNTPADLAKLPLTDMPSSPKQ